MAVTDSPDLSVCLDKVRVLWVHNTPREGRMFLWDVLDAMPDDIAVDEVQLPLRPGVRSIHSLIKRVNDSSQTVDVVHAQFGSLVGFAAAFGKKRFILTLRGTDFYVLPSSTFWGRIEARARQVFTYIACMRANLVVVMSERMRGELRRWPFLGRKRVMVIVDPLGEEFVSDAERTAGKVFTEKGPLNIVLGSLSGESPVKRTWLIERAVEICQNAGISVRLNIVAGLQRSAVKDAIAASDLMALTSTHEGWPNIIKEGLALGVPFIATDVSDLRKLCSVGSLNRIVEPDELDIALAIVDIMAIKYTDSLNATILTGVVAKKHQVMYTYLGLRK